jgi:DNA-binding response OmpR family regulator
MRVLLVEDDDGVAEAVADALGPYGHVMDRVSRGGDALIRHREADVVLLDIGLPDINGLEVLHKLRRMADTPVIVLTAYGDERTVVRGLRLGADDYLVKPVRLDEMVARIEAVLRRVTRAEGPDSNRIVVRDIAIDLEARRVRAGEREVELTAKEFDILSVLAGNLGVVVRREQVLYEVWGYADPAVSRSLDVHITQLRAKLDRPGLLTTIRGVGFRLEDN